MIDANLLWMTQMTYLKSLSRRNNFESEKYLQSYGVGKYPNPSNIRENQ